MTDSRIKSCLLLRDSYSNNLLDYHINRFPDRQISLSLAPQDSEISSFVVDVAITSSEVLDLWLQLIYSFPVAKCTIRYYYGARSDKRMDGLSLTTTTSAVIKSVLAEQNSHTKFTVISPHCWVDEKKASVNYLNPIQFGMEHIDPNYLVVFPDSSARRRGFSDIDNLGSMFRFVELEKQRTPNGIVHTGFPETKENSVIIVDDICDGGGTFLSIASAFKGCKDLRLFVTHGIFSNDAIEKLFKAGFTEIRCLDTYPLSDEVLLDSYYRLQIVPIFSGTTIKRMYIFRPVHE